MYSAVIILAFISITYAVPLHPNNEPTKEQSFASESATINNPSYSQDKYLANLPSEQTYPIYVKNKNDNRQDNINPNTAVVQTTSPLENIADLMPIGARVMLYSNHIVTYLLRYLTVGAVGIAIFSLICMYTSLCNFIYPKGNIEVQNLARMYITPENLDNLTTTITKAVDQYTFFQ